MTSYPARPRRTPGSAVAIGAGALLLLALLATQLGLFSAIASDACVSEPDPGACEDAMMPGVFVAGGTPLPIALVGIAAAALAWRNDRDHPLRPLLLAALAIVLAVGGGIAWVTAHTP